MSGATTANQTIYKVADAAKILCVSESTINKLVKTKQLPAIKIGMKSVRITRDGLALYVKASGGGNMFTDVNIAGPALADQEKIIAKARVAMEKEAAEAKVARAAAKAEEEAKEAAKAKVKGKK